MELLIQFHVIQEKWFENRKKFLSTPVKPADRQKLNSFHRNTIDNRAQHFAPKAILNPFRN